MYSMHLSILANFVSLEGERRIGLDIHTAASIGDLQVHSTHYLVHKRVHSTRIALNIHTAASIGDLQIQSTHHLVLRKYISFG